jgi:DNA polymerase-3 subunit alpha
MYLIYDTETTGLPKNFSAPVSDSENWPRLVQIAWQLHNDMGELIEVKNFIVRPEGFTIPYNAEKIHGISTKRALDQGVDLSMVLEEFNKAIAKSKYIVGHNIVFDINIMGAEFYRTQIETSLMSEKTIDTKEEGTDFCAITGGRGGKFKWPTLTELHTKLFSEGFNEAHNASADVEATTRCFLELIRLRVINYQRLGFNDDYNKRYSEHNRHPFELLGLNIEPYTSLDPDKTEQESEEVVSPVEVVGVSEMQDLSFSHLHCHSSYSVLQASCDIPDIIAKAKAYEMPAVALTDTGNMYAAYKFVREAIKNDIKPILGCEIYLTADHKIRKFTKENPDRRSTLVLLAKHRVGYHNLAKLSSQAFIDGLYAGCPRIDKDLLLQYKEGLIVTTGGLTAEIPNLILNVGESQAEEAFKWWHQTFGDDFYVELIRHGLDEEEHVNQVLLAFARKYGVKYFASNNVYYIDKEDALSHDILLCVKDGVLKETPIGRGRGFRFGFPNDEFYFKSQDEMKELFKDLPESIATTQEIVDKIEVYDLKRDVLLPAFDIPEEFVDSEDEKDGGKRGENNYLRHLTYVGAKKRYTEITDEIRERLDFELLTIENTGYPGYFLIVQDFTTEAHNLGVSVGPGRGSAAGSAVAYCTGITNVDPIAYDLLFERFLNPDRVSLPDIDIDFDDEGRGRIIDFVLEKYGESQVAQIITYGTMAAKSSIRDAARVLNLPLHEADRIAKLVPDISLHKLFNLPEEKLKEKLNADQMQMAAQLKSIAKGSDLSADTLNQAIAIEGSVRNIGIHACGVIITPSDIREHVPMATAKDSSLLVTQFDNSVVEDAGLLKMDFLGLKTLSIIKDAIALIKEKHDVIIDPDEIPLDDELTYELYQMGSTNGTFQFESPGMQKHLRALKPDKFGDLIAMNALYRPGPLEYIPNFIARKHGREEITYDLEGMEDYLAETYGITVYQEQVMLLSQKLAGFSKGDADMLRKAMGKKIFSLLEKMKPQFIDGCAERNHDPKVAEKVWKDWEAFAAYAFNKSHSTCYSVVAFHTAYLKAHYPAEYMASVMTHNMNDIKKVTFFMEECKRMHLTVLGPDINESAYKFNVNNKGEIRFGLGAIKGVGEGAVENIVNERKENGYFNSIYSLTKRVELRSVNKRTLENLALAGAFDSFESEHRAMYFHELKDGYTFLNKAIRYGNAYQESLDAPPDLFGSVDGFELPEPPLPVCDEWERLDLLAREKEVVGIYISGHPLDDYAFEIKHNCNHSVENFKDLEAIKNRELSFAGVITDVQHRIDKNGNPYGLFVIEDFTDSKEFMIFRDDYLKFKMMLVQGAFVYVKARVQSRSWNDQLEIKILAINLLSNVLDKLTKSITLRLNLFDIDEDFVDKFQNVLEEHKGKHQLKFNVYDPDESISLELLSRTYKVKISKQLVQDIGTLIDVQYKLN